MLDVNRARVPLIEIVTKPIGVPVERAPEVARAYVTALRDLLRALDVSDVRMDQGSLRCDANVSLRPVGQQEFGTRTRPRTSTPSRASRLPSATRCAGRQRFWTRAEKFTRRPGTSTKTAGPPRAATRRPPRTTGISRSPTSNRWLQRRDGGAPAPPFRTSVVVPQADSRRMGRLRRVMRDLVNAGAVEMVAATVAHGASSEAARAWWGNFLVQKANEADPISTRWPSRPRRWPW